MRRTFVVVEEEICGTLLYLMNKLTSSTSRMTRSPSNHNHAANSSKGRTVSKGNAHFSGRIYEFLLSVIIVLPSFRFSPDEHSSDSDTTASRLFFPGQALECVLILMNNLRSLIIVLRQHERRSAAVVFVFLASGQGGKSPVVRSPWQKWHTRFRARKDLNIFGDVERR
jgi:hypothetical protein